MPPPSVLPFTTALSLLPAEKRMTFEAAIVIGSPVRRLRPCRSPRSCVSKLPKPWQLDVAPLLHGGGDGAAECLDCSTGLGFRHGALVGDERDEVVLGQGESPAGACSSCDMLFRLNQRQCFPRRGDRVRAAGLVRLTLQPGVYSSVVGGRGRALLVRRRGCDAGRGAGGLAAVSGPASPPLAIRRN